MKRFLMGVFTAVMLFGACFGFAACDDENTLKVGTSPDFAPFEFLEKRQVVGFDVDLLNMVAEKIDMKIKFKRMDFDAILAAVASGKVDLGVSGFTINDERKESVLFSRPYIENEQVLVVKPGNTLFDDLDKNGIETKLVNDNIKIGACTGYVGADYVKDIIEKTPELYENFATAVTALDGKVDVLVMDKLVALEGERAQPDKIKVIKVTLVTEEYGMAMKLGNTALKEKIDKALDELFTEGKIDELKTKWEIDF